MESRFIEHEEHEIRLKGYARQVLLYALQDAIKATDRKGVGKDYEELLSLLKETCDIRLTRVKP